MINFDTSLTLEELEKDIWPDACFDSHLVQTCHRLRKMPVNQLTVENLRMLIGQNIGLDYIAPFALEILFENPFAQGDFYDGDLLINILRINKDFWIEHIDLLYKLFEIIKIVEENFNLYQREILPKWVELRKLLSENKTFDSGIEG